MRVERPDTDAADELADLWVALARGQRAHGSHLLPDENRARVREVVVRHVVTDSLLVARDDGDDSDDGDGDTDGDSDADGALVGFVMFSPEANEYEQDVTRGVVHNLYVREDRRGEGVGADLLAAAEDALRERGAGAVALEVMADNEDARRFYRSRGYTPHRVEMEKSLDGPSESDTP